ncbi:Uncharacterised protein [Enterobacter cloacae]|nr:Uncharacterised protein [Enterobacter cloacae]
MGIDFTGDFKTHHKRVSMQAATFVPGRNVWKVVCGFEGEIFKQCGGHHSSQECGKNRRIVPESTIFIIN